MTCESPKTYTKILKIEFPGLSHISVNNVNYIYFYKLFFTPKWAHIDIYFLVNNY